MKSIDYFHHIRIYLAALLLLFISTVSLAVHANEAALGITQETTMAELLIHDQQGQTQTALLLDSTLEGQVDGLIASITLKQTFKNPSTDWVNGKYVFPLPQKAAVDSLTLKTDGRIIRGVVKEKNQAKKEFEAAKASGKKAGLLQQSRPNLFSMSLANIPPNAEVVAQVTWVEAIKYESGRFSLRLPTTLTPRFIPGKPLSLFDFEDTEFVAEETMELDPTSGWARPTDQVTDAPEITPFQISSPADPDSHRFSLNLLIKPGIPIDQFSSMTHGISIKDVNDSADNASGYQISLSNGTEKLDRDVVIHWSAGANHRPNAAVFSQQLGQDYYSLLMLMPPVKNVVQTLPKEIIFIIDSSGSMAGVSMPQAKQGLQTALGYLSPTDRFNVIDFDSHAVALFPKPVQASQSNIALANGFVSNLHANGGTNMEQALNLAFSQAKADSYLRQIVFITDGSVGNENTLFQLIHARLGDARLFTMGIGSAPNSHFMRGAAHYGRGTYSYIDTLEQAASQMAMLFERINRPVMRDIKINWDEGLDGADTLSLFPSPIPDLYVGEPLNIVIRSDQPLAQITIEGSIATEQWRRT